MDISMQMSGSKNRGHTYKVMHAALQAIRRNGGTLIGIPDNALGSGNPNLLSSPEFAGGLADAPVRAGLVTLSSMAGYDNALAFGHDGSTLSHALKTYVPPAGVAHTMSVIVEMTDGLAPSWGAGGATGGTSPFAIVGNGQLPATGGAEYVVTLISGNTYRVAWTFIPSGSVGNNGVYKYAANNSRTFKVTGYKLEPGNVATPYTPQSVLRQRGAFTDSAGITPVTALADLFGLVLDRMGTVGPEKFTGTLNFSDSSWTKTANVNSTGVGTFTTVGAGGVYTVIGVGSPSTKTHETRIAGGTTVALTIRNAAGSTGSYSIPVGTFDVTFRTPVFTENGSLYISAAGAGSVQITALSTKELTGTHATQPTPAQKPTLVRVPKRLGPNLVVNGDGSNTTGWTAVNGTLASVGGEFVLTASAGASYPNFNRSVALQVGKSYRIGSRMRVGTSGDGVGMNIGTGFSPAFNALVNSTTTMQPWSFVTTATATTSVITAAVSAASATVGTSIFDDIEVCEVLEWTNAISFDGSNDFLQTGITTGNEGWLCAAVNVTDSNSTFFCSGAGSNVQKGVWMYRTAADDRLNFLVGDGVLVSSMPTVLIIPANTPTVVDAGWTDVWQMSAVNGVEASKVRTNGSASPPPNPLHIGAYTNGVTYAMNGSGTAFLHCQTVPTEAERDIIRKWMAYTNRAPYWGELPTLSLDFVSGDYLISNGEV